MMGTHGGTPVEPALIYSHSIPEMKSRPLLLRGSDDERKVLEVEVHEF